MQNGGKRAGAGRPPGATNKRSQEIVAKAAADGVSPIEVMLEAMRVKYAARDLDGAAEIAAKAAPYCHPRLSAVDMNATLKRSIDDFTDAELEIIASEESGE